ncbi:Natural resistance-associated macrophage protein [Paenibacillus sp. GP183]|nr:Natural resistance-associated macrophage protein [Paenibacillus sp. GP183]
MIITTAFAFNGTELAGVFDNAGSVAAGLAKKVGSLSGAFFAIILLNASLIGADAVTLSTSYAFGDVFGIKHSLHRKWKDARGFYTSYTLLVLIAGGIVLIPNVPLGLITMAVQALAGVLLPSATVFLLLLCNDKVVLGPWVNKMWLNMVSSIIVGVLVMLSFILSATTLFPSVNVKLLTLILTIILIIGLLGAGLSSYLHRGKKSEVTVTTLDRSSWRMPPLRDLPKPEWTRTRKMGMVLLRSYLVNAVLLLIVKAVQIAIG